MTLTRSLLAAAALALSTLSAAPAARAQGMPDFTRMNLTAMNNGFNARLNAQMAQNQNQIMRQNMADPRVIAAYRQNPRGMSFPQFALMYGATAGFTPGGVAAYNNTSRQIAASDAAALQRYRAWQAGPNGMAAALADRSAGADYRSREVGYLLRGCTSTVLPDGRVWRVCP